VTIEQARLAPMAGRMLNRANRSTIVPAGLRPLSAHSAVLHSSAHCGAQSGSPSGAAANVCERPPARRLGERRRLCRRRRDSVAAVHALKRIDSTALRYVYVGAAELRAPHVCVGGHARNHHPQRRRRDLGQWRACVPHRHVLRSRWRCASLCAPTYPLCSTVLPSVSVRSRLSTAWQSAQHGMKACRRHEHRNADACYRSARRTRVAA
jgi:hypothetical protein